MRMALTQFLPVSLQVHTYYYPSPFLPPTPIPFLIPRTTRSLRIAAPLPLNPCIRGRHRLLGIRALDAALPFDCESRAFDLLKIAIVGFGNHGQFLARTLVSQGHTVLATSSCSDHSAVAGSLGVSFFPDPHDLCEEHPDIIILTADEYVLRRSLPIQRLRLDTLFVSVMGFPKNLLLQVLPEDFDILCIYLGPESSKFFTYEKVRIQNSESRADRCQQFLQIFKQEGCRMMEMPMSIDHEIQSQLPYTAWRILAKLEKTCSDSDSFNISNVLSMFNKNATKLLDEIDLASDSLIKAISQHLHDKLMLEQVLENPPETDISFFN